MERRQEEALLRRIRLLLAAFTVGLVLSGLTALPLKWEIDTLCEVLGQMGPCATGSPR